MYHFNKVKTKKIRRNEKLQIQKWKKRRKIKTSLYFFIEWFFSLATIYFASKLIPIFLDITDRINNHQPFNATAWSLVGALAVLGLIGYGCYLAAKVGHQGVMKIINRLKEKS